MTKKQDLDELLSVIGTSIRDTLTAVEEHSLSRYLDYFETREVGPDGDTQLEPKTVTIPVPQANGSYQPTEIPVVALLPHDSLQLEELHLRFRVQMDDESDDEGGARVRAQIARPQLRGAEPDTSQELDRGPSDAAEVELVFKRSDASEGISRLVSSYYKGL